MKKEPETDIEAPMSRIERLGHRSKDYLVSAGWGTVVAMGSVYAGRKIFPKQLDAIAKQFTEWRGMEPTLENIDNHRRALNTLLITAGGITTANLVQVSRSRSRREDEHNENISILNDMGRVTGSYLIGGIGSYGALFLTERSSPYVIKSLSTTVEKAEKWFDGIIEPLRGKHIETPRLMLTEDTPFSESLQQNITMTIGAMPVSLGAQALYDEVVNRGHYKSTER